MIYCYKMLVLLSSDCFSWCNRMKYLVSRIIGLNLIIIIHLHSIHSKLPPCVMVTRTAKVHLNCFIIYGLTLPLTWRPLTWRHVVCDAVSCVMLCRALHSPHVGERSSAESGGWQHGGLGESRNLKLFLGFSQ